MDLDRVVEGYYIRLRDGTIWSVKGCCRCSSGIVALPRVVGDRKIKGFFEALSVAKERYPEYIGKPSFTTYEVPIVPLSDISEILEPSTDIKCSPDKRSVKTISVAKEFLEVLDSYISSSRARFYITGSLLYCGVDEDSDLDLVAYDSGSEHVEMVMRMIQDRVLTHLDYSDIDRSGLEGLDSRSYMYLASRSINEVKYRGLKVTFRFVRCRDPMVERVVCGEKTREIPFEGYISILNDSLGVYTPSIYKAVVVDSKSNEHRFLYVYSHRIRYASLTTDMTLYCSTYREILGDGSETINLDRGSCSLVAW